MGHSKLPETDRDRQRQTETDRDRQRKNQDLPMLNTHEQLDSKTNLSVDLDSKSHLNILGMTAVAKKESESNSFDSLYGTLDEAASNKRKHSSTTSSECNFEISDIDEREIKKEDSYKQKLSKFRRSEKALKPIPIDNLPNLNNLGEDITSTTTKIQNGDFEDDFPDPDDQKLLDMLEKNRAEKENKEMTSVPESPDPFSDNDDEFMNNLDFSDLAHKSSKKPLFCSSTANNLRHFPAANQEKESRDMFDSDDDEIFNFDEKIQVKPSLESADEIEEPEEVVRRVTEPKKKSVLKKKSLGLQKKTQRKSNKSFLPDLSSDDDFK